MNYQGNGLTHNTPGNARQQSSQLAEPLNHLKKREEKKEPQAANDSSTFLHSLHSGREGHHLVGKPQPVPAVFPFVKRRKMDSFLRLWPNNCIQPTCMEKDLPTVDACLQRATSVHCRCTQADTPSKSHLCLAPYASPAASCRSNWRRTGGFLGTRPAYDSTTSPPSTRGRSG